MEFISRIFAIHFIALSSLALSYTNNVRNVNAYLILLNEVRYDDFNYTMTIYR